MRSEVKNILNGPGDNGEEVMDYLSSIEVNFDKSIEYWTLCGSIAEVLDGTPAMEVPLTKILDISYDGEDPERTCSELVYAAKHFFLSNYIEGSLKILERADSIHSLPYRQEQFLCALYVLTLDDENLGRRKELRRERGLPTTRRLECIYGLEYWSNEDNVLSELRITESDQRLEELMSKMSVPRADAEKYMRCFLKIKYFDLFNVLPIEEIQRTLEDSIGSDGETLNSLLEEYCYSNDRWYAIYTSDAEDAEILIWTGDETAKELKNVGFYGMSNDYTRISELRNVGSHLGELNGR
ncbi:MAG: hypothetical protein KC964_13615 [Candidatus Omnitrophica bacterium]|nr:hypothetical protein [Candidatus Omnitrophota bacterium]